MAALVRFSWVMVPLAIWMASSLPRIAISFMLFSADSDAVIMLLPKLRLLW